METQVLVIGGGATGAGVALDLALRGVRTILVEMGDLATGTSGRYHGLLHSGGRYAVKDPESAKECIDENLILKQIAPHVLEDTGGLFILCPGDGDEYAQDWLTACAAVGIETNNLGVAAALRRENVLNPKIRAAYEVPDATCDSWDLAHALKNAAEQAGAKFLTYHRVESFHIRDGRITGAQVRDLRGDTLFDISFELAVNAAGPWAAAVAEKAGAQFSMKLSRGAMLAFNVRWVNTVINRLRAPGDGDIFVPVGTVSVTGTTSVRTEDPGDTRVEPWEVQHVLRETEIMTPGISAARVLRAWGGVRPLYDPGLSDDGRGAARTFAVLDHAKNDNLEGLVSILGGKLTTYRLMAERTVDVVCAKLGVTAPCITASTSLPALEEGGRFHLLHGRLDKLEHKETPGALICECEIISAPQIVEALHRGDVVTLNDLRRDLRLGMGPCQGGFCSYRAAGLCHEVRGDSPEQIHTLLREFVERRLGGMKALLWAHNLRQALLDEHLYTRVLGLSVQPPVPSTPPPAPKRPAPAEPVSGKVLVVGAGLAGLTAALAAHRAGAKVELVAFGQGALTVHPGWLELGDVEALRTRPEHPYALTADALPEALGLIGDLAVLQRPADGQTSLLAVTTLGARRPVSYGFAGALPRLTAGAKVAVIGIAGWRDFFAGLIADALNEGGYRAEAHEIRLDARGGTFDDWPVDIAKLLDTPEGLKSLVEQVRPHIKGVDAIGFPAVLGLKHETLRDIGRQLDGVDIFEIPTLSPSVPGLRLYHLLRETLLEAGVRITMGTRVTGLVAQGSRLVGVQAETASPRPRTISADAVILATGGLYGGGIESDYQRHVWETLGGLAVKAPEGEWFTHPFLAGQPQPIHLAGVVTDERLRPLAASGAAAYQNLFAAGRLLGGFSAPADACGDGVDISSAVLAVRGALEVLRERALS